MGVFGLDVLTEESYLRPVRSSFLHICRLYKSASRVLKLFFRISLSVYFYWRLHQCARGLASRNGVALRSCLVLPTSHFRSCPIYLPQCGNSFRCNDVSSKSFQPENSLCTENAIRFLV